MCHKTNPDPANCSTGYAPALNNTSICCSPSYPYYSTADNKCHKVNPNPKNCSSGYAPAVNNTTVCCPNGYPYYGSSDNKCHTINPNPVTCGSGYAPAVNNTSVCCPVDYPYSGFNGYCYKTPRTSRQITDDGADDLTQEPSDDSETSSPQDNSPTEGSPALPPDEPADSSDEVPPEGPDFMPPGGGSICNAYAYQTLDQDADGTINVKLVFEGELLHPIRLTQVKLIDPNGIEVTQDYHAAFGNGYVYFERRDGRQWLPGQYVLGMTGQTDGEQEVVYSAEVMVDTLEAPRRGIAAAGAPATGTNAIQVPVGDRPADITGDNGWPATICED